MVRVTIVLLVALAFYVTPVWLFDQLVTPQLVSLRSVYTNAEAIATSAAGQ